ncbi:MAG: PQQ-dependent sugar dehydrogenase [Candidatus Nanopelagicales bacterium]
MSRRFVPVLLAAAAVALTMPALVPASEARTAALDSAAGPLAMRVVSIPGAVVHESRGGARGPAMAALPDGRVLLGGGPNGRQLLLADPRSGALRKVGTVIRANQRRDDARFAPTDIEVMSTTKSRTRLFISYPEWVAKRRCVRLAVDRVDISLSRPRILRKAKVLRSKPCVPPRNIQHTSGRLVRISNNRAYVSLGDLGYPDIADRGARGQLGSVLRIGKGVRPVRISQGHRNGQGLLLDRRGLLWETEHGPRGGDELNLIVRGRDYGWPFVTLGQPYGSSDYVMPRRTGTHAGYTAPRTAWVPSVATSELVQVPSSWRGWTTAVGGDLLMGTLKDRSLWRIRVSADNRVVQRERISVGQRLRDLDVRPDRTIAATTDDGKLLILSR